MIAAVPRFEARPFLALATPLASVERDTDQAVAEITDEALEPRWRVLIHNDDVTPFEFVIMILQRIFGLLLPDAELVTFVAHTEGIALVATLPRTEAQKRVGRAHFAAALEGYPLQFTTEPE